MTRKFSRRKALSIIPLCGAASLSMAQSRSLAQGDARRPDPSTYRLNFTYDLDQIVGDLMHSERGDPRFQSDLPHGQWNSEHTRHAVGSWGPRARSYPPLAGLEAQPLAWQRERVIAAAARFIGYAYQHHHIPDWDPPPSWPWRQTCAGRNGKGFDCSNFTSFVYNQGFGIHMSAAIGVQAQLHSAREGRRFDSIRRIDLPADYRAREQVLCTGDLVYIRGREGGPITHVVLWVGATGRAPSGVPLVLDSHGPGVVDDLGRTISCGVQLRPFRPDSWYNRCASHAHRIFQDTVA